MTEDPAFALISKPGALPGEMLVAQDSQVVRMALRMGRDVIPVAVLAGRYCSCGAWAGEGNRCETCRHLRPGRNRPAAE